MSDQFAKKLEDDLTLKDTICDQICTDWIWYLNNISEGVCQMSINSIEERNRKVLLTITKLVS
jgi:hypothetical protein